MVVLVVVDVEGWGENSSLESGVLGLFPESPFGPDPGKSKPSLRGGGGGGGGDRKYRG